MKENTHTRTHTQHLKKNPNFIKIPKSKIHGLHKKSPNPNIGFS